MAKKIKHGGKRKTAGRKPIEDKKVAVTIYVRKSVIDFLSMETLKGILNEAAYLERKG